ncbi:MAG: hypothetical protein AAF676_07395 [Pseudomonadota bacterium]
MATPLWFASALRNPLEVGPLTAIPAAGCVCLVLGVVWGLGTRERRLWAFAWLPLGAQALVVIAGLFRGQFAGDGVMPTLAVFLLLQAIAALRLIVQLAGARGPAALLTAFSLSYALFAAFVAGMAFSDSWV